MVAVGGLAMVFLVVFPWVVWRRGRGGRDVGRVASLDRPGVATLVAGSVYFAAIGAGFMLVENVMIQRFVLYLGHPSHALTVVLASLLVGMGGGSLGAARVGLRRLRRGGALYAALLLVLLVTLPPLFAATLGWPREARVAISWALLCPVGFGAGLFFPLGMLRYGDALKPWFWAVNGVFGVLAGVFSLALSMEFGFRLVSLLAVAAYGVAWGMLAWGKGDGPDRIGPTWHAGA
jgi:hypothetical protein